MIPDWLSLSVATINLIAAIVCASNGSTTLMWLNLFFFATNLVCGLAF